MLLVKRNTWPPGARVRTTSISFRTDGGRFLLQRAVAAAAKTAKNHREEHEHDEEVDLNDVTIINVDRDDNIRNKNEMKKRMIRTSSFFL
jgi:hypothetical protein